MLTCATRFEADVACGRLEEAGIRAVIADNSVPSYSGPVVLPGWMSIHVMVPVGDVDAARKILCAQSS